MKVNVNGKATETAASTIAQLVEELRLAPNGVAVGVDGNIVRRTAWTTHALTEGNDIVIVKAACGG